MAQEGSQEWIDESLARLEVLESEREGLDDSDPDAARLDEEIGELYGRLESVAEGEGEAEEEEAQVAEEPVYEAPEEPAYEPAASAPEDDFDDDPFGSKVRGAAPVAAASASNAELGGFGDGANQAITGSFDEIPKSGALKWVVLLLLAGGGVGGFMWWQGQQDAAAVEADSAPTGPGTVVQAVAVPEDTEDIKTAKGQDVDRLPGAEVKKTKKRGGGGGGTRSGGSRTSKTKKGRDGKIELSNSDDPLG